MFKSLKEKIKSAVSRISKKVEEEAPAEVEELIEEKKLEPEEKTLFEKIKEKIKKKKKIEEIEEEVEKIEKEIPEKEKGIFKKVKEKITSTRIYETKFNELFWGLEVALLENNVAVEVIEEIKENLKKEIIAKAIKRSKIENTIKESLKNTIEKLFEVEKINLIEEIKKKKEKPYVMVFVGVNGSGKTTTIAKIVNLLQKNKLNCVLAASDTWRAASIEQLQEHADKLKVKVIKHNYGSDPAAVAFDAIKHAKAKDEDVVLIDTAGRQHANINLMDEMRKIIRVAKPDLKLFIGESIVGNDCVEQAKQFNEAIEIDGIILAKADVDEKGGAAISVSFITKKPILYLGVGQRLTDLKKFNKEEIISSLGF